MPSTVPYCSQPALMSYHNMKMGFRYARELLYKLLMPAMMESYHPLTARSIGSVILDRHVVPSLSITDQHCCHGIEFICRLCENRC